MDGLLVPIPINLESKAIKNGRPRNSEEGVVSQVGRELYEKFFKGYTKKQWDLDPSELDASVTARIPTRSNKDNRYFTDIYQAMPLHGYTKMFEKMLDHPNIKVMLNTDYKEVIEDIPFKKMIYTGPVDYFYNYCYGKLPYRSINFEFETHDQAVFQKTGTVNYPNEHPYTRITEFKYLTGQQHKKTAVVYEYPTEEGDPYYPVPRPENALIYNKYHHLATQEENVFFAGRLATYKYYNMDQVVAQALSLFKKIHKPEPEFRLNGHKIPINAS